MRDFVSELPRRLNILAFAFGLFVLPLSGQTKSEAKHENPPIEFENISPKSGVKFILDNSTSAHKYKAETMAGGVAMFDYDNDGLLDLYFTNGASLPSMDKSDPKFFNRLYRNNGDGTFTDVTLKAGVQGCLLY